MSISKITREYPKNFVNHPSTGLQGYIEMFLDKIETHTEKSYAFHIEYGDKNAIRGDVIHHGNALILYDGHHWFNLTSFILDDIHIKPTVKGTFNP